jgi:hypothetical protein
MKILFLSLVSVQALAGVVEKQNFDPQSILKVEVENIAGEVRVNGSDSSIATVETDKLEFGTNCSVSSTLTATTLSVKVTRVGTAVTGCRVNLNLTIPRKAALEINSGAGDLLISGISSDVKYKVGAGNVQVDGEVLSLSGEAGSGSVTVKGLVGSASMSTGSGDVNLTYSKTPSQGELEVRSGTGNTNVFLPSSAQIFSSIATGNGTVQNDFTESKDAPFRLSVKSGSGDLKVKKAY